MNHRIRRLARRLLVAVAVAGLLAVGGCGGGGEDGAAGGGTTPPPATTASEAETGTVVTAELSEFTITLSQESLRPGTYTFVVEETGQLPHALSIRGPGVDSASTPVIQPGGDNQRLTVTLQSGTYELWCPVGNHRQQGMELTVTTG